MKLPARAGAGGCHRPGGRARARAPTRRIVPSPFRFCLRCRTSYEQARGNDFAKLAKLSAGGPQLGDVADHREHRPHAAHLAKATSTTRPASCSRSSTTARTPRCRPGTSTTSCRSPSCAAPCTGRWTRPPEGLTDEIVAQRVTEELGLAMADFARNPGAKYSQRDEALAGAAGGDRVPALPRPGTRLAGHHAEPGADRPARASATATCPRSPPTPRPGRAATSRCATTTRRTGRRSLPRCSTSCAATWPSTSSTSRDDGFDLVRRLSAQHLKEPWSLPERELPPIGRRRLPRARQAGPAAQQRVPVRPRPVRPVPDPRVRRPQDHPEDRRCPGDHRRPVQRPERGRAADGGRASPARTTSRVTGCARR